MILYTSEEKQTMRNDIENGLSNLKRCISFLSCLESEKAEYELEECIKDFLLFKNLKDDINYSIDFDMEMSICDVDYFLVKRWCRFNLEFYKAHLFYK